VNLFIIESGAGTDRPYSELGNCTIKELPPNLPAESKIAVTISYDASARVQVSARDVTSGREAHTEIERGENVVVRESSDDEAILTLDPVDDSKKKRTTGTVTGPAPVKSSTHITKAPIPQTTAAKPAAPAAKPQTARPPVPAVKPVPSRIAPVPVPRGPQSSEIMELPLKKPAAPAPKRPAKSPGKSPGNAPGNATAKPPNMGTARPGEIDDPGAEEFWKLPD